MTNHEEEKNYNSVYYIVAMLTGIFVGAIIERGAIYLLVGAVLGLLSAAAWIKFRAKSSYDDKFQNF